MSEEFFSFHGPAADIVRSIIEFMKVNGLTREHIFFISVTGLLGPVGIPVLRRAIARDCGKNLKIDGRGNIRRVEREE